MAKKRRTWKRREYADVLDHIEDDDLYKAVMFAMSMMKKGEVPGRANRVAADYYNVATEAVAEHTGRAAARIAAIKRERRKASGKTP